MAEKTIIEKAAMAVGYGIAMVEDVAGTAKTAVGAVVTTVSGALNKEPAVEASKPQGFENKPAKVAATMHAPAKKAAKKASAKKVVKKASAKKVVKAAPAKKVVKKTSAKKAAKKVVAKAPAKKSAVKKAAKKVSAKKAPAKKVTKKAVR